MIEAKQSNEWLDCLASEVVLREFELDEPRFSGVEHAFGQECQPILRDAFVLTQAKLDNSTILGQAQANVGHPCVFDLAPSQEQRSA